MTRRALERWTKIAIPKAAIHYHMSVLKIGELESIQIPQNERKHSPGVEYTMLFRMNLTIYEKKDNNATLDSTQVSLSCSVNVCASAQ